MSHDFTIQIGKCLILVLHACTLLCYIVYAWLCLLAFVLQAKDKTAPIVSVVMT